MAWRQAWMALGHSCPAFRLQDVQPCKLHGLFRSQLFFFQRRKNGLHGFKVRRVEVQGYFRLVQPGLGFQGRSVARATKDASSSGAWGFILLAA